jgi:hypothetical protein
MDCVPLGKWVRGMVGDHVSRDVDTLQSMLDGLLDLGAVISTAKLCLTSLGGRSHRLRRYNLNGVDSRLLIMLEMVWN